MDQMKSPATVTMENCVAQDRRKVFGKKACATKTQRIALAAKTKLNIVVRHFAVFNKETENLSRALARTIVGVCMFIC